MKAPSTKRQHPEKRQVPISKGVIDTGNFRLEEMADGRFWLEDASGEGLETSGTKLDRALQKFFEEEF